jgi:hypothetical protein
VPVPDALEQFPEDPKLADREFAEKWLRGEWIYMNQKEQDEYILLYGTRKQRKAVKERQKARAQPQKPSK